MYYLGQGVIGTCLIVHSVACGAFCMICVVWLHANDWMEISVFSRASSTWLIWPYSAHLLHVQTLTTLESFTCWITWTYALFYSFLALISWIYLSDIQIDSRCAHEIAKQLPIGSIVVLAVVWKVVWQSVFYDQGHACKRVVWVKGWKVVLQDQTYHEMLFYMDLSWL